jgi:hypothetical protein
MRVSLRTVLCVIALLGVCLLVGRLYILRPEEIVVGQPVTFSGALLSDRDELAIELSRRATLAGYSEDRRPRYFRQRLGRQEVWYVLHKRDFTAYVVIYASDSQMGVLFVAKADAGNKWEHQRLLTECYSERTRVSTFFQDLVN